MSPKPQPFEIIEVPDQDGGLILELRANGLRLASARASAQKLHDMEATRGLGRDDVRELLASSLGDLQLAPELDRQVFGYWFGPGETPPPSPVGWPTGAILPAVGRSLSELEVTCLDLVPVHNYWLVLSERGVYTYRHTAGLLNGETDWRFVPARQVLGEWPVIFNAALLDPVDPADIESRYGFEAATRARLDAPAVQLRLQRTK